jgi:hypothetical protein
MANETERLKPAPRSGALGWGDRHFPEPDAKAIVDRVMDPDRGLPIKKEDRRGQ